MFHAVFLLFFLAFIKLLNYIFILLYKLNFLIRFFVFSKSFTKRIFSPIFPPFSRIDADFIHRPHFYAFMDILSLFFLLFLQLCKPVDRLFSIRLHNSFCSKLFTHFIQLFPVLSLFRLFPLIFALYLSLFSLIIRSTARFETSLSPLEVP